MTGFKSAIRQLRKSPGFTSVAVFTLALGIGANTAIFGFLDRVFLRPLPVAKPHELVTVKYQTPKGYTGDAFIYPLYASFREQSAEVFSGLIAYWLSMADLRVGNSERQIPAMAVSGDYFSVLGVKPVVGRTFLHQEDRIPGAHPVAMISHTLWQKQWGGDPTVLGKTIRLNDHLLTVVGVLPSKFTGTYAGVGPAVYVPLAAWANIKNISLEKREYDWLNLLGRLKPGVSPAQAQAALRVVAERIHKLKPTNTPTGIIVADGSRGTNVWTEENLWWPFALVQAVTVLILLGACANVTNLLLMRGVTRQKEIAIRLAIGAGRGHVIRQLMVESTVLALLGGACGILLAQWLTGLLRSGLTVASVANMPVDVDLRVLAFGLLASLATALVCGLAPALRASRPHLGSLLNEGGSVLTILNRRWNLRSSLVVTQVALTMIVLAFGALCLRSLTRLKVSDPGFNTAKIVAASAEFKRGEEKSAEMLQRFANLKERVEGFPGVKAVCLAADVPLTMEGRNKTSVERMDSFPTPPDRNRLSLDYAVVSPGFFRTLGVPLLQGRDFTPQDKLGAPTVLIVNELFAQRFWPNQNPVGKYVRVANEVRQVIGVVESVKLNSIQIELFPQMFWPIAQPMSGKSMSDVNPALLVRTSGSPKAVIGFVRQEMEASGLGPTVCDVRTLSDRMSDQLNPQRLIAATLNAVGLVGLLFAATGIFGIMAYEVSQRRREIGIRVALGAQWWDVRGMILHKGAVLTLAGIGLGLVLSAVPMGIIEAFIPEIRQTDHYFLYGVHIWDPLTYIIAALAVMAVALIACWLPARCAAKTNPMEVLRYE